MASQCLVCHEDVNTEWMKCSECDHFYHLGSCSGVSDGTYKTKNEAYHRAWKCQTCRLARSRSGSQASKPKLDADIATVLADMSRKLDALPELKETVNGIELSVQAMSDKYDEVLQRMEKQDNDIKNLKKRVEIMEQKNYEETIKQLKLEVQELEWRSRRLNLEFHGIPKSENEDLLAKVNVLATTSLDLPELTANDVVAIHRLPSRPEQTPGVIVRFSAQNTRDRWLDRKSRLRGTDRYISENMTRQTRTLLATVRDWTKQKGYAYTWHKNGKVFIRKKDGDRAILIRTLEDLGRLDG